MVRARATFDSLAIGGIGERDSEALFYASQQHPSTLRRSRREQTTGGLGHENKVVPGTQPEDCSDCTPRAPKSPRPPPRTLRTKRQHQLRAVSTAQLTVVEVLLTQPAFGEAEEQQMSFPMSFWCHSISIRIMVVGVGKPRTLAEHEACALSAKT